MSSKQNDLHEINIDLPLISEILQDYVELMNSGEISVAGRYCPSVISQQIDDIEKLLSI